MTYFGFKDLSSLSDVDMTIYRYVTNNVNEVVYMRVRDIAQNAHVSSSSVMRFIHKIGFNSFPEFKTYLKSNDLEKTKDTSTFQYINKQNFPRDINSRLTLVADKVFQSDNVITIGMGESAFLAEYAARRLAALGFNTTAVTDPFYPLKRKLENTSNNILICYSVSGETTELIELINSFANDEDAITVCITSNEDSSIAKRCRYVLPYYEQTEHIDRYFDFSSQVPVMYIIEGLDGILKDMIYSQKN